MKSKSRVTALAVIVGAFVSLSAVADNRKTPSEMRSATSTYSIRASDVIGAVVVNGDNVELGEVDDIVIVRDSGELHAIVSVGGILGIGEALYSVRFDDLKAGSSDERVFLDISQERFLDRPQFEYLEGEQRGRQLWEKRLALKEKLAEERDDLKHERSEVARQKQRIRELERQLEALRKN